MNISQTVNVLQKHDSHEDGDDNHWHQRNLNTGYKSKKINLPKKKDILNIFKQF